MFLFGLRREDLSLLLLLLFFFLAGGGGADPDPGNRNSVSLLGCGH